MARATVPVTVRWADLDAYRHVNNVAMMQLLEEARIALFWHGARQGGEAAGEGSPEAMSSTAERDTATFVVHQEVEYITPLGYPSGPLPIQVWVSHVGGSS
ncbi:MAG: acyl-CoA thioesterase, partial [bacterium]|nr:acyl-CoA thioesterase [bacterium]